MIALAVVPVIGGLGFGGLSGLLDFAGVRWGGVELDRHARASRPAFTGVETAHDRQVASVLALSLQCDLQRETIFGIQSRRRPELKVADREGVFGPGIAGRREGGLNQDSDGQFRCPMDLVIREERASVGIEQRFPNHQARLVGGVDPRIQPFVSGALEVASVALREPEALPLVGVGWGAQHLAGWAGALELDGVPLGVEGRQAVEETLPFVPVAKQRGNKRNLCSAMGCNFWNGACQCRMRRNFHNLVETIIEGSPERLRERNGCPEVSDPVLGIERFTFSKAAVNGRVEGDLCGLARERSELGSEVTEQRVHMEAMRCEVHIKQAGEPMLGLGLGHESLDGLSVPGDQSGGG